MELDVNQVGKTTFDDIITELRLKYLQILKSIYWNAFESEVMTPETWVILNESVD